MDDISTNKQIRREQFRATAKHILQRADGRSGPNDRIGQLGRAMERAYAAGAEGRDRPEEHAVEGGVVRWDAIPPRARLVLEMIGIRVKLYEAELRTGDLFAIFEGVGTTAARGERARLSYWERDGEGGLLRPADGRGDPYECAASSVSGLVRLGIVSPLRIDTPEVRPAVLTKLGIDTVMDGIARGRIFAPDM